MHEGGESKLVMDLCIFEQPFVAESDPLNVYIAAHREVGFVVTRSFYLLLRYDPCLTEDVICMAYV